MDAMGIEDVCGAMDSPTPANERMTSWKIHQYLKASQSPPDAPCMDYLLNIR